MPTDRPAVLTIDSPVLGPLTLAVDDLFAFTAGLVGMPDHRRFALVDAGRPGLSWLQSADDPSLVFVLVDPFRMRADYAVELPDADLAPLGAARPDEVLVLAIVTLGAGGAATANLRAPVVLNLATRRGRQVVLTDDRYGVTEPVAL